MISKAIQSLQDQAKRATQNLVGARTQLSNAFANDYVVGTSEVEGLLSAQESVRYWGYVAMIIKKGQNEADIVLKLSEWATQMADRLLEPGRSSSTSLISNAIALSGEDELKQVLRQVRQFVSYAGTQA